MHGGLKKYNYIEWLYVNILETFKWYVAVQRLRTPVLDVPRTLKIKSRHRPYRPFFYDVIWRYNCTLSQNSNYANTKCLGTSITRHYRHLKRPRITNIYIYCLLLFPLCDTHNNETIIKRILVFLSFVRVNALCSYFSKRWVLLSNDNWRFVKRVSSLNIFKLNRCF